MKDKCPHCNGTGREIVFVNAWQLSKGIYKHADIHLCTWCLGTGEKHGD